MGERAFKIMMDIKATATWRTLVNDSHLLYTAWNELWSF